MMETDNQEMGSKENIQSIRESDSLSDESIEESIDLSMPISELIHTSHKMDFSDNCLFHIFKKYYDLSKKTFQVVKDSVLKRIKDINELIVKMLIEFQDDQDHENKLFALTYLRNGTSIYNTSGVLNHDMLDNPNFITEISRKMKIKERTQIDDQFAIDWYSGRHILAKRNRSLDMETDLKDSTPDEYLENWLKRISDDDEAIGKNNRFRFCSRKKSSDFVSNNHKPFIVMADKKITDMFDQPVASYVETFDSPGGSCVDNAIRKRTLIENQKAVKKTVETYTTNKREMVNLQMVEYVLRKAFHYDILDTALKIINQLSKGSLEKYARVSKDSYEGSFMQCLMEELDKWRKKATALCTKLLEYDLRKLFHNTRGIVNERKGPQMHVYYPKIFEEALRNSGIQYTKLIDTAYTEDLLYYELHFPPSSRMVVAIPMNESTKKNEEKCEQNENIK